MGLVVHAVQALHDSLLELVDDFRPLARLRIDLVDALVVDLDLEILRPAAIAAKPAARARLRGRALHVVIVCRVPAAVRVRSHWSRVRCASEPWRSSGS